ncbi:glycosyltransferase family 2 protein [Hyphococcus sp. DH-69]|uniref:glycosyltransferase family 2 protein n=1 Tax=Hyphococcus formosus TaxID=3143534 RepID=UPI00398B2351
MRISVCIFARNEERLLPVCVNALPAAGLGAKDRIHILVNGCSDNTAEVANALASAKAEILVHELPVGDKANAWNEYVHRIADTDADAHIFLDGDIKPSIGAISALAKALADNPEHYAAGALPVTGRSRRKWARTLLVHNYISGNLYAMSKGAVRRFRELQLHLPFGAKGEDGLISYLLLTDLKGGEDDSYTDRIVATANATFEFESLGLNLRDLALYRRRLRRYSERHFQKQILYRLLKKGGIATMPENIKDIYTPNAIAALKPRWDPVNLWFDLATLGRLRNGSQEKVET